MLMLVDIIFVDYSFFNLFVLGNVLKLVAK